MSPKNKVLLYNFLSFGIVFFILRFFLMDYVLNGRLLKSIVSAVLTMILVPKFILHKTKEESKIMMKWLFIKGFKEL